MLRIFLHYKNGNPVPGLQLHFQTMQFSLQGARIDAGEFEKNAS